MAIWGMIVIPGGVNSASAEEAPVQHGRFEDALLARLTRTVRDSLSHGKPVEIKNSPAFMDPRLEGMVLLMGENTRMTIFLATPPSGLAVNGAPTVWISPFDDFGYALRVIPETELGQRLNQCLKLVNKDDMNKEIPRAAVDARIRDALSRGSKEELEATIARMNAKDQEAKDRERGVINKLRSKR